MYRAVSIKLLILALWLVAAGCNGDSTADGGTAGDGPKKTADTWRPPDVGKVDCKQKLPVPNKRIWPVPGEVFYMQIGLIGKAMAESAIIVGPRGKMVLVDAGNDAHDGDIRRAIMSLQFNMNKTAGFPKIPVDRVDHVIITHFHSDHSDGIEDLLRNVSVAGRVVHRGVFDVGATNASTVGKICSTLSSKKGLGFALCAGAAAPCSGGWSGTYPATGCPGLAQGDILDPKGGGPAYIKLWGDTRVQFLAANGRAANGDSYEDLVKKIGSQSNDENARSIMAVLRHGKFRLLINGDLTGGGIGTHDLEGFYSSRLGGVVDHLGVDVLHAAHHARKTSTQQQWANRVLPRDGRDRNVVMGVSPAHTGSPHQGVLDVIFDSGRLGDGLGWTTLIAPSGSNHGKLVNAKEEGFILVRTTRGGQGYVVQAVDAKDNVVRTRAYYSARACP